MRRSSPRHRHAQLLQFDGTLLERAIGFGEPVAQPLQLVFALGQFRLQLAGLRLQLGDRLAAAVALDRQPLQLLAIAVDLDDLRGGLVLEALDAHFQAPCRHGELGAQAILVSLDIG